MPELLLLTNTLSWCAKPEISHYSFDAVTDSEECVNFPTEFLKSQSPPGMLLHNLTL
jgi:hypothetical protein